MKYLTTIAAREVAAELGLHVSLNTVRDTARKHDLIVHVGRKCFVEAAGWMALIERRQPEPRPRRPTEAKTRPTQPSA